jgi:hypothetical protein
VGKLFRRLGSTIIQILAETTKEVGAGVFYDVGIFHDYLLLHTVGRWALLKLQKDRI